MDKNMAVAKIRKLGNVKIITLPNDLCDNNDLDLGDYIKISIEKIE